MLKLLEKTRSYRRFQENRPISSDDLRDIISAVRLCPAAANLQRVRIAPVTEPEQCEKVFENLGFAAYLNDWKGPAEGERPVAYLVIMTEKKPDVYLAVDAGIAAEAMLLVARERGIGGCLFGSFTADGIHAAIGREGYEPVLVIALGYPAEEVVIEDVIDGNIRYYRDENGVHHVPKRGIDEIIV